MMNIQSAIKQVRNARKSNRISEEQQIRIMRRLGLHSGLLAKRQAAITKRFTSAPPAVWVSMMELRNQIEQEIMPILLAKREAERDCFDVEYIVPA